MDVGLIRKLLRFHWYKKWILNFCYQKIPGIFSQVLQSYREVQEVLNLKRIRRPEGRGSGRNGQTDPVWTSRSDHGTGGWGQISTQCGTQGFKGRSHQCFDNQKYRRGQKGGKRRDEGVWLCEERDVTLLGWNWW